MTEAVSRDVEAGMVAILAGSGELPLRLADSLRAAGRPHRVLALRGFADRALRARADAVVGLLDVGRIVACLDEWRPVFVTLAGGLRRPSPAAAVGALGAIRNRDEVARLIARVSAGGDDGLLRSVGALLEARGLKLVGVRDLAPELLAEAGQHGRHGPGPDDLRSIRVGLDALAALAAFDFGQAAIVIGERVVALEGPEGTDATLARARALRPRWPRRREGAAGILVKAPKRGQDLRVDLPAIGPRTIANAAAAGLRGVAIASGGSIVLNRRETVAAADRLGLFLVGVDASVEGGR